MVGVKSGTFYKIAEPVPRDSACLSSVLRGEEVAPCWRAVVPMLGPLPVQMAPPCAVGHSVDVSPRVLENIQEWCVHATGNSLLLSFQPQSMWRGNWC